MLYRCVFFLWKIFMCFFHFFPQGSDEGFLFIASHEQLKLQQRLFVFTSQISMNPQTSDDVLFRFR